MIESIRAAEQANATDRLDCLAASPGGAAYYWRKRLFAAVVRATSNLWTVTAMNFSIDEEAVFHKVAKNYGDLKDKGFTISRLHKKPGSHGDRVQVDVDFPQSGRGANITLHRAVIDKHLLPALMGGDWPLVEVDWGDYK